MFPTMCKSRHTSGEMTLRLDNHTGVQACVMNATQETNRFHLVYARSNVATQPDAPQEVGVNLVHRDGNPALTGHYLVETPPGICVFSACEYFVSCGKQRFPFAGSGELTSGDVTGVAHVSFVGVALDGVEKCHPLTYEDPTSTYNISSPCSAQHKKEMKPQPESLDVAQRTDFVSLWERISLHLRDVLLDFHGPCCTPEVITSLGDVRVAYASCFSQSSTGSEHCKTLLLRMDIPEGTPLLHHARIAPTQLFPSRLMLPWTHN